MIETGYNVKFRHQSLVRLWVLYVEKIEIIFECLLAKNLMFIVTGLPVRNTYSIPIQGTDTSTSSYSTYSCPEGHMSF